MAKSDLWKRIVLAHGSREGVHNGMHSVAATVWRRKPRDHIFHCKQEKGSMHWTWVKAMESQSPLLLTILPALAPPPKCYITPTRDQVFIWSRGEHFSLTSSVCIRPRAQSPPIWKTKTKNNKGHWLNFIVIPTLSLCWQNCANEEVKSPYFLNRII